MTEVPRSEKEVARTLGQEVHDVLTAKSLTRREREDRIVEGLTSALERLGRFYRTEDGTPVFFRHSDRRLYEVSAKPDSAFGSFVTWLTDTSVATPPMKPALERLQARVAQTAERVQIHGLAYNSPDAEVVAVNDFGGGMWYRHRGGAWEWRPNGFDGILFWTPDSLVEAWTPEFSSGRDEDQFAWFLEQPNFADAPLTAQDQRHILRVLILSFFFPSLNRTRPIQAHLGQDRQRQHDTGKTTAGKMIGLLFMGRKFQPTPAPEGSEKGQEAVQLALMHQPFVLLDNVDTEIRWLNDFLCTYATGARPSKRKLYTDATQVHIEYRGRLAITSRRATFTRVDTATRTIPFRFKPISPATRKTEPELLDPVLERRGQIWAGVLSAVARVQDALPRLTPPAPTLRLADFEQFGWRVAAVDGQERAWEGAMRRLRVAQAGFALEDEPLVPVLRELLRDGDVRDQPTSQLYEQVRKKAGELGLAERLPRDAAAFTRRLNELREPLESVLDVKISDRTLHGATRVSIVRVGPEPRGDRGDRSQAFSSDMGAPITKEIPSSSVTSPTPLGSHSGAESPAPPGDAKPPVGSPTAPATAAPGPEASRPGQEPAGLLTLREAAELLGVSPWTVRRWVASGKLPHIRLPGGRLLRFDRADLDRLVEAYRVVPEARRRTGHHSAPRSSPPREPEPTRAGTPTTLSEDQE
jgi:excisionase family DNA binding protein